MRKWFFIFWFVLTTAVVQASPEPVMIKVNGIELYKSITEVIMDDNVLALRWNDNTLTKGAVASLMMQLAGTDCVDKIRVFSVCGIQDDELTIEGLQKGDAVIYDLQGRKVISQPVEGRKVKIDISGLNTGVYLLKNDCTLLKFVKR